jgi:hypothetical protein
MITDNHIILCFQIANSSTKDIEYRFFILNFENMTNLQKSNSEPILLMIFINLRMSKHQLRNK